MGIRDIRADLGRRVDEAYFREEVTLITKNDETRAALVSHRFYERALRLMADEDARNATEA